MKRRKEKKYPSILADERMAAIAFGEEHAKHVGRDIEPSLYLTEVVRQPAFLAAVSRHSHAWDAAYPSMSHEERFRIAMSALHHCHYQLQWLAVGMPVYRIDQATATALACTSVDNVRPSDIRSPYPAFCVYFDHPISVAEIPCRLGRVHTFIPDSEYGHDTPHMGMELQGKQPRRGTSGVMPLTGDYTIGERRALHTRNRIKLWGDALDKEYVHDEEALSDAVQFFISLILYITTHRPRPQTIGCAKISTAIAPWGLPREWIVAPSKIESGAGNHGGEQRSSTSPRSHVVRGHWRMQAYGPGRSMRRPLWIRPHWKGELEPAITKDYHP